MSVSVFVLVNAFNLFYLVLEVSGIGVALLCRHVCMATDWNGSHPVHALQDQKHGAITVSYKSFIHSRLTA